jgi:tRNA modification GTPase
VDIDYPDEDYGDDNGAYSELISRLRWVHSDVEELLDTASIGRIAREGVRVVLAGKPNAGKSSLMNAILGEGRVIVTDVPGTTRDTVEESASLGGVPIVLIDTAGLRETGNAIETIGISQAYETLEQSDLVLYVIDASIGITEEDQKIFKECAGRKLAILWNKTDLDCAAPPQSFPRSDASMTMALTTICRAAWKQWDRSRRSCTTPLPESRWEPSKDRKDGSM